MNPSFFFLISGSGDEIWEEKKKKDSESIIFPKTLKERKCDVSAWKRKEVILYIIYL